MAIQTILGYSWFMQNQKDQSTYLILLITFIMGPCYLPFNYQMELVHEEPRRVVVTQNMMESGNYLVPTLNDRPYLAKPPLYNWLMAASLTPFSEISEFHVRLNTWMTTLVLCLFMLWLTRGRLSQLEQIFLSFALFLSPHMAQKIALAEIEILFVLLVTASLWTWWMRFEKGLEGFKLWAIPCALAGLSFLAKREPALVFFYFPIAVTLLWKRRFWELFKPTHLLCALMVIAISSLWLGPVISHVGLKHFLSNMNDEVIARGGGNIIDHFKHLITYPSSIIASILPFSFPLFFLLSKEVRGNTLKFHGDFFKFGTIVILSNLPIYLLRPDIATRYFLPMHPTLLLLSTLTLSTLIRSGSLSTFCRWISVTGISLFGLISIILSFSGPLRFLEHYFFPDYFVQNFGPSWISPLLGVLIFVALISSLLYVLKKIYSQEMLPPKSLLLVLIIAGFSWRAVEIQFLQPQKSLKLNHREQLTPHFLELKSLMEEKQVPYVQEVLVLGGLEAKLWFYDKNKMFKISNLEEIKEKLHRKKDVWVIYHSPNRSARREIKELIQSSQLYHYEALNIPHRNHSYKVIFLTHLEN